MHTGVTGAVAATIIQFIASQNAPGAIGRTSDMPLLNFLR